MGMLERINRLGALTPSLPPRVAELARVIGQTDWGNGEPTRFSLPTGWPPLTSAERDDAAKAVQLYDRWLDPKASFEGIEARHAKLEMLTVLIAGTTNVSATEVGMDAKLDLFEMALEDVPAWSIAKAVRRWMKQEVPKSIEERPNYNFTPSPQTIRGLAMLELAYVKSCRDNADRVARAMTAEEAMKPPTNDRLPAAPALRSMR